MFYDTDHANVGMACIVELSHIDLQLLILLESETRVDI